MTVVRDFIVLGFASVHDSLDAEATLRGAGLRVTPIPSPRELGELCGVALRLEPEDAELAVRLLGEARKSAVATARISDVTR